MQNPISTYRIQFHNGFTFVDFERIIPYLDKLGIRTIYASPIVEAVPGSQHGYDSVNPNRINPEIGTEDQLNAISHQLKERGMNWIQDIVPNHMAFHPNNTWLMDVLEKGQKSPYASFFDIDWNSPVQEGRLMVPFLNDALDEAIGQGDLTLAYQAQKLVFRYQDTVYPLHLRSYATLLKAPESGTTDTIRLLVERIGQTLQLTDPTTYLLRDAECQAEFATLMISNDQLQACLKAINTNPGLIRQIADEQVYRLCYYGETDHQINYRRFFTVNSLICLNSQDPTVFDCVHERIKALLNAGIFQGLRVDHVDGLFDPSRYLEQLRELAGDDAYIVVEKILKVDEDLPAYWPVQGATGYGFLSLVNNLFTRTSSETSFTRFYQNLLDHKTSVRQELDDKKAYILYEHMNGELENLYTLFLTLNLIDKAILAEVPPDTVKLAIGELLIQCPIYRYYGNRMPLDSQESKALQVIFDRIRTRKPALSPAVDLLNEALLVKPQAGEKTYNQRALRFYQRCMQFTGPLMAKGVEDTLMYSYNRFIGHSEVGDSPEFFGMTTDDFHQRMIERQSHWPLALNTTSTHDTKRGEDVRSRLNVLTDLADEWITLVQEWQQLNRTDTSAYSTQSQAPDQNDEYFIYQTLLGTYPMPGVDSPGQEADDFSNRLMEYLSKALREAKRYSTYDSPDEAYEEATKAFAMRLLEKGSPFMKSFQPFHRRVADFGIVNSLAQVVLKCTCPGLPDVYQGCELWDFTLVDPDNRRAVDFTLRQQWMDELTEMHVDVTWLELWEHRYDARIKLWLLHILLNERKRQPELFAEGYYIPLQVDGHYQSHVFAFARRHGSMWCVIVVPLGLARLCSDKKTDGFDLDWKDTQVILPDEAPKHWEHVLQKTTGRAEKGISVADLFKSMPLAVVRLT